MDISAAAAANREQHRSGDGTFGFQGRTAPGGFVVVPALDSWEPNYGDFPYPQANDIEKVLLVADLVHADVDTADGIATAISVHPREGDYYANAAGWLGLVEKKNDDLGLVTYIPTELGTTIHQSDPAGRAAIVSTMIGRLDDAHLAHEDPDALRAELEKDGLSPSTAARRTSTMAAWMSSAIDASGFMERINGASADCAARADGARVICFEQRKTARAALAASQPRRGGNCPTCHMEMPLTGECGMCA